MRKVLEFKAESRSQLGTSGARATRDNAMVPAVIYGLGKDNEHVALRHNEILREFLKPGFRTSVIEIETDGKKQRTVVKAIQIHPVSDQPVHLDFLRVDAKTPIELRIPVRYKNHDKSPGIKRGATLNTVTHYINVVCGMDNIPDYIYIDLTGLKGGDRITLANLQLPEGVKLGRNAQPTVCNVVKGRGVKGAAAEEE